MSRRNLFILNMGKNILLSNIPKSITVRFDNKLKIKIIKNTNKSFLSPKVIDYVNYVHKRNFSGCKNEYNRHLYDEHIEKLINEQINVEFVAGYTYLTIANYYGRSNIALPGHYGFFMKMYYEEQEHALSFIQYQILRGGVVCLKSICPCETSEFPDIVECFGRALAMEKSVKEKLQYVYKIASNAADTNVQDMLDLYIDRQFCQYCGDSHKCFLKQTRICRSGSELFTTAIYKHMELANNSLTLRHIRDDLGKLLLCPTPATYYK